ncbi:hypothetical protein HPB50_018080 [Hyalomma asiaticum]|uniref:Uncharacterized protein n=1 Tax=Hyalomma asiaticum TaxID=266040 RepID=A0ACB7S7S6_HYAAI|nr:hypothetical protein HPB50_018080 [Hyalomma asiaticum]
MGSALVDHIVEHFSQNVWNQETSRRFRFVWINATTFEPYALESSLEPLKSSASNALSSLKHVFCSLTPNARKIFLLIARHQLDNAESPLYAGMSFHDCYHRCREAFLVNSDLTLRAQLREFLDHMLLKIKKPDALSSEKPTSSNPKLEGSWPVHGHQDSARKPGPWLPVSWLVAGTTGGLQAPFRNPTAVDAISHVFGHVQRLQGHDGSENLLIPIEAAALTLFVDQQEEDGSF